MQRITENKTTLKDSVDDFVAITKKGFVINNVDRVEVEGTAVNIITKNDVLNPSIGPTCRVTDEGEHGMATLNPPYHRPAKEKIDIAAPLVR